jgi:peptidoglycan/LPS O-acetylase OafA/YrhL
MKKVIILFVIAILVLTTTGIWIFSSGAEFHFIDIVQYAVIVLVVVFAIFLGYKRLSSLRRGEPAEDEMSRKVIQRSAGLSYYISIYLWLIIMYLSDKSSLETHTLIGAGILGMAVIFALCWLVIHFTGIRHE